MKRNIIKDIVKVLDLLEVNEYIDLELLKKEFYGDNNSKKIYRAFFMSVSRAKNILSDKFFYKDEVKTLEFSETLENLITPYKEDDPLKNLRVSKLHIGSDIKLIDTLVLKRLK